MRTRSIPARRVLHAAIARALSQGAFAQSASPSAADRSADPKDPTKGEQVVVTARRREELIQDVPTSVSAFSGAAIEQAGIQDVTGISELTPNTTLKTSRATNTTLTAFIRGIGQQDPVAGYEQGVGIYLDDVYLARPQGALQDIYDLARIEILRGPQGTLYGRNTIGGAVKYVTKKLGPDPELQVKVGLGNYNEQDYIVRGNLPVGDNFRIGATVASFNHEGYGKNVVYNIDNYNKDVLAGRISFEFTPTRELFVRFAADHTRDDSNPREGYRLTNGPAPTNLPPLSGDYDTRANLYSVLGMKQKVSTGGESLLVDYALTPEISIKSISAHRHGKSTAPIDFDSLNQPLFEAPALYHDDQKSQEFQATFSRGQWAGVGGLYWMKANAFNEFDALLNAIVPQGLSLYTFDDMDTTTWAAFADLTYAVNSRFDVELGARYTSDNRRARIFKRTYLGLQGSPTLGNPSAIGLAPNTDLGKNQLDRTDTKVTPKVAVTWKIVPGQNAYASYSEGFKAGMFDPRMDISATGGLSTAASQEKIKGVKPEEVSSFEVGLKSSFDRYRVQTNIAAFYMDYKNVQIPGSIATYDANGNVNGFAGNVTNAGKAKVSGLELEAIARLTDQFTLQGMYGFIDAKYKEWIVANGLTGSAAGLINVAGGAEFQNTPRNQFSITGTYEIPMNILSKAGSLALQGTAAYKDKTYMFEFVRNTGVAAIDVQVPSNQMLTQNAYTVYDASLIWTSRDRKWTAGIVGRNLADKRYKVAGYPYPTFFNTVTAFYGDPRTVKFIASVTF